MNARKIAQITLTALFVAIVIGYGIFRFVDYAKGSTITITSPQNGSTLTHQFVDIEGTADRIVSISLDGQKIFINPAGHFSQKLLLSPGYNILQIKVTDRFGRVKTKTLHLVYKPPEKLEKVLQNATSTAKMDKNTSSTKSQVKPH